MRTIGFTGHRRKYKKRLKITGELVQMVERSLSMREVVGSMPTFSIWTFSYSFIDSLDSLDAED